MSKPSILTVQECKIQAAILLKSLCSKDFEISHRAAKKLQKLPEFAQLSLDEIIQAEIKHKHALAAIALEKGFKSWAELKCQLPFIRGGFLNHWFSNYAEAKSYQKIHGGFLLPYKTHYFICDANYITHLGLDPHDSDWQLIGKDWSNPVNKTAWQRLYAKWMQIQENKDE
ncbi:MAG: hypothetical protein HWD59_12180 [Coxiellaceae bacterium]|nr:MAG: hypothetical protein HWD59_12180 [Coxiellaceae bacterium]